MSKVQKVITPEDVFASHTKFGCVLKTDVKDVRDLKTINPKSKYDVSYFDLKFKHVNGSELPVKIKFSKQLIASGAKAPQGADDESNPKNLNISFSHLKRDDIATGDYVPKTKDTPEKQEIENKRMSDTIDEYMEINAKFLKVLDIIESSYQTVCQDLIANEAKLPVRIQKDKNQKNITIHSIKQTSWLNRETKKDEKLEHPIFRVKIPICQKNGLVGVWSNYNNEFKPIVFDARKMTEKNKYQPVPAKVMVEGKLCDLDAKNAGSFITYKSLIGGNLMIKEITCSKFGFSLSTAFYDLFVIRHKAKAASAAITREEIIQMRGDISDDDSDAELAEEPAEEPAEDSDEDAVEVKQNEPTANLSDPVDPVDSDDEPKEELKVEEPKKVRGRKQKK